MNAVRDRDHDDQVRLVQDAFSRQGPLFDTLDEEPLIQWVREHVRHAVMAWLRRGDRLLEINCGTGIDSLWFAQHGVLVTATDNAPGMLAELKRKHDRATQLPLEIHAHSFLELGTFAGTGFDMVFSNFGGINCTDQLATVLQGIDGKLRNGGVAALVIMPRFSPWELIEVLRGNFRSAFRRFGREGSVAHVEGVPFRCWYHDAGKVRRALPGYVELDRMALSFVVPPPHLAPFAAKHPRLLAWLKRVENGIHRWPFVRSRGDHYLIILRKPG